jgi:hypothetical protein
VEFQSPAVAKAESIQHDFAAIDHRILQCLQTGGVSYDQRSYGSGEGRQLALVLDDLHAGRGASPFA